MGENNVLPTQQYYYWVCRKDHPEGEYQVELRLSRQESGQLVHTEKGEGRHAYTAPPLM